ncbi:ankyrin repeat-containing domain protein [Penicillium herquei]|nr:ankyrin repeat-containing domain protein [Penicillium herquei]
MDEDVQTYVEENILQLPPFVAESKAMMDQVKDEIVRAANGMFLLASLHLGSLRDKITSNMMKSALKNLPRGSGAYEAAYREAMERIESQMTGFKHLAIQALSWISCAQRPLTTFELQHALAIQTGANSFDKGDLVDVVLIASVCAGLFTIDEKSNVIRLVHYTAQEFFDRFWREWFPQAHRAMADACTAYLLYDCIDSDIFDPKDSQLELYAYSAQNWGHHARLQSVDETLAFRFLENQNKVSSSARQFVLQRNCCEFHTLEVTQRISSLHLAAYFGLEKTLRDLVGRGADVQTQDDWGRSALSWAAEHNHKEVAKYLLDCGLDMDVEDELTTSPIIWAVINGHVEIAKLFASEKKDVGSTQPYDPSQVELICEARNGHIELIKSLLLQGVTPNFMVGGYTPIQLAARYGHYSSAKLLLEYGANPDTQDNFDRSALYNAAVHNDGKLTRLLLSHHANANLQDTNGSTALIVAATMGNRAAVEPLIEFGADPNIKDNEGDFPLIQAVRSDSPDIIELLFKSDLDMNLQDANDGTALICAAVLKQEEMITLLLSKKPQLDLIDHTGSTALIWGAYHGCFEAVNALIESGANMEVQDQKGKTALIYAIEEGHEPIVSLLLDNGAGSYYQRGVSRTSCHVLLS